MAQISGGTVSYERRVKTGDYEHKHAAVTLTFSVGDGENYADVFDLASRQAVRKAHEILGFDVGTIEPPQAPSASSDAGEPKRKPGRPPGTKMKQQIATPADAAEVTAEAPEAPAQPDDDFGLGEEPAAEVTDLQLTEAAKTRNAAIKAPVKIKELIKKYTPEGVQPHLTAIPQAQRSAFLSALGQLSA